jgi:hypothetical protein
MADGSAEAPEPSAAAPEAVAAAVQANAETTPIEPDAVVVPIRPNDDAGGDAAMGDATGTVTSLNSQITDAVTQANATVLGEAPGFALALVCQSLAQATSLAFLNATQQQQQANMIAQAATAAAVARLLGGPVP